MAHTFIAARYLRGFTIIELLVTLSIVAIVFTVVAPAFGRLYQAHHDQILLTSLRNIFNFTRSQALQHNAITTLCPIDQNTGACTNQWSGTVSVFVDRDNNKQPDNNKVLRIVEIPENFNVVARPANKGYFQYTGGGLAHGTLGGLVICHSIPDDSNFIAYIAMNMGGRYRRDIDSDKDGVIQTNSGDALTCPS